VEPRGRVVRARSAVNHRRWEEPGERAEAEAVCDLQAPVWEAWLRVKANGGAAGVDEQSLQEFERDLKDNFYKL
jgi:RNA-directed DNA polymerase